MSASVTEGHLANGLDSGKMTHALLADTLDIVRNKPAGSVSWPVS